MMATEYLRIYMLGFPLFMLSMVGSTLLRATGSATSPGLVMAGGSVLQIGIAPLLIFGLFGFPDLGVAGAAWAYVASRIFSVALYLVILLRVRMISWSLTDLGKSWGAILHVGGPATLSSLTFPISMLVITRLLAGHGDEVVAGYTVASRVETLVHMVIWSASSSVAPFVGQNWGAANYQRVRVALRQVNFFCLGWGVVTFIVLALVGETIVRAIDSDPTVVMVAGVFFLIMPLSIGFMGVMHVATYCFNALGQPLPPLVLSILRSLALYAPLAILGNYLWGYVGIFLATAFSNVVLGVGGWYWNRMAVRRGIAKRNAGNATAAAVPRVKTVGREGSGTVRGDRQPPDRIGNDNPAVGAVGDDNADPPSIHFEYPEFVPTRCRRRAIELDGTVASRRSHPHFIAAQLTDERWVDVGLSR